MRKPSKKEFLRLNNIVPAASAIRMPSRKRPPRNTRMYADAIKNEGGDERDSHNRKRQAHQGG